jgi:hypothetical protein
VAALSHVKSDTIGDFTGTITGFNSAGSTTTIVATDLVRPVDWNSAHNFFQTISGATAGAQSTASGTNLVFAGTNGVALSFSTGVGAATLFFGGGPQQSFFRALIDDGSTVLAQVGNGTVMVYPVIREGAFTASRADIMASMTISSSSNSSHAGVISVYAGIYTLNGSTLSLLSSGSQSHQWSNTSNNSLASLSGLRRLSMPFNVNYTGGQDLFVAIMSRSSTTNANWFTASNVVIPFLAHTAQIQGLIGEVSNGSRQLMPGQGIFSATSSVLPGSMGLSQLSGAGVTASISKYVPNIYFLNMTA